MKLLSVVSGRINDVSYSASGISIWDGNSSIGGIKFDKKITDYSIFLSKSWKCKNHSSLSLVNNKKNPLGILLDSGEPLISKGYIKYPGYHGCIEVLSKVVRNYNGQVSFQNRSGNYDGPINVSKQLNYVHNFIPQGNGFLHVSSLENLILSDGNKMSVEYFWEYKVPVFLEVRPFRVYYNIVRSSLDGLTYSLKLSPSGSYSFSECLTCA